MTTVSMADLQLYMVSALFILGLLTFSAGVFVLTFRAMGGDVHRLATHTARLAQKGLAQEASGMVGNAVALMRTLNDLVRTATGIGIFLIFLGSGLMYLAFHLSTTFLA